jgi:hypothetical protein
MVTGRAPSVAPVACCIALLLSVPARADEGDPGRRARALSLVDSAMAHYKLAEYRLALADLVEADRLFHGSAVLLADAEAARTAQRAAQPPTAVEQPRQEGETPPAAPPGSDSRPVIPVDQGVSRPPPKQGPSRLWLWVTLGVAGAVVIGGAVGLGIAFGRGTPEPMTTLGTYPTVFQ